MMKKKIQKILFYSPFKMNIINLFINHLKTCMVYHLTIFRQTVISMCFFLHSVSSVDNYEGTVVVMVEIPVGRAREESVCSVPGIAPRQEDIYALQY